MRYVSAAAAIVMLSVSGAAASGISALGKSEASRIVFVRSPTVPQRTGDLHTIDPSSGVARQLTRGYRDGIPMWSPDGRRVAFVRALRPKAPLSVIYVMNTDGSRLRRLTNGGPMSWSPDGRQISFSRRGRSDGGLYVVDANGGTPRRLVQGFRIISSAWSPDGSRIIYEQTVPDVANVLRIVNADGTGDAPLVGGMNDLAVQPAWAPDGETIAFVRAIDDKPPKLYLMDSDGSNPRSLTGDTSADVDEQNASWSPDGRMIAFVRDIRRRGDIVSEVAVINADGGALRTIARQTFGGFGWVPTWSPDGKRIAFISRRDGNPELYVVNAGGSQLRRLTRTRAFELQPLWQPGR